MRLKAYYINTELDEPRRLGMEATCSELDLDCSRVVLPRLGDAVVRRCVEETKLRAFECSLAHAHRGILRRVRAAGAPALVLEDDARLNPLVPAGRAQEMLREAAAGSGFVMAGWRHGADGWDPVMGRLTGIYGQYAQYTQYGTV